jgi:hypothetical protein
MTITHEAEKVIQSKSLLYFFTDNKKVEVALCKGNSRIKRLLYLVVRFRKFQFKYGLHVVISRVSGKRMISQGRDGISCGCQKEGLGLGASMLAYIPLHLGALKRHEGMKSWLISWNRSKMAILSSDGWYGRGHIHDHDGGKRDRSGFLRLNS